MLDATHLLKEPFGCGADGATMTLPQYWNMEPEQETPEAADGRYGRVYSEADFLAAFRGVTGNGAAPSSTGE
jgi:hypothetical protein